MESDIHVFKFSYPKQIAQLIEMSPYLLFMYDEVGYVFGIRKHPRFMLDCDMYSIGKIMFEIMMGPSQ